MSENLKEIVKSAYGIKLQFFIGETLAEVKNYVEPTRYFPEAKETYM